MDVVSGLQYLLREVSSKAPADHVGIPLTAAVTSTSPLTVVLDGDITATPRPADGAWVPPPRVGDTVRCEMRGGDLTVTAIANAGTGPYAMAAGVTQVSLSNVNYNQVDAPLPSGRFTVPPIVTASCTDYTHRLVVRPGNARVTAVTIGVGTANSQAATLTATIAWQAVQMTPTSAAG